MKSGRREALILGAAGFAAAAAGFLIGPVVLHSTGGGTAGKASVAGDIALPAVTLVDLAGQPRKLSEWRGRVLMCNFWATWCGPCLEEIPLLMAAREKYSSSGFEIVGIAIDSVAKVRDFSASLRISYPVLMLEADGIDLMRKLGNGSGGLPYTVVADRLGRIVQRKLGAFKRADLDAILGPLTRI